ncbi:MAG: 2Fe-2S iron-sulfur cluster-binding protein, partial [Actinobacteria bacterium]|nr:2Fe-2S iron-sulfur cluster-binding protein [Actinomycetota bacterium]
MAETKKYLIKFLPDGRSIKVPPDYNLRQAILDSGLDIDSSCGGVGTCGRCRVKVTKGDTGSKRTKFISASDKRKGFVLSCLAKVKSDLEVEIPKRKKSRAKIAEGKYSSRTSKAYSGISTEELSSVEVKPWFLKENLIVEEPTLSNGTSDLYRIKKSIKETTGIEDPDIPIHLIRKLPDELRRQDWK